MHTAVHHLIPQRLMHTLRDLIVDPSIRRHFSAPLASCPALCHGQKAKMWAARQGDNETAPRRLTARLQDQKHLKTALLRAKLRGEVSQGDFEQANTEFGDEIAALEGELQLIRLSKATLESFVRFAELSLTDLSTAWSKASPEQRGDKDV